MLFVNHRHIATMGKKKDKKGKGKEKTEQKTEKKAAKRAKKELAEKGEVKLQVLHINKRSVFTKCYKVAGEHITFYV